MEQEQVKELKVMDPSQWEVARCLQFTYNRLARPCRASLVYFRPISDVENDQEYDVLDTLIINTLRNEYSDLKYSSEKIFIKDQKDDIRHIYDGGRPHIGLLMNVLYEIVNGQCVNDYQIVFHIFLTTIERVAFINDYLETTYLVDNQIEINALLNKLNNIKSL